METLHVVLKDVIRILPIDLICNILRSLGVGGGGLWTSEGKVNLTFNCFDISFVF